MSTKKAGRIPPESENLEFVRNNKTGCVHILSYGPESYWVPPTRADMGLAAVVLDWWAAPRRMLCGTGLLVGASGECPAVWESGDGFADDNLCIACVMAPGDQQWRAFHVDNRGDTAPADDPRNDIRT